MDRDPGEQIQRDRPVGGADTGLVAQAGRSSVQHSELVRLMARSKRVWLPWALLVVITSGAACSGPGRTPEAIRKIHVVGDRQIEVTYDKPTCEVAAGHDVRCAADTITITMYSRTRDGCVFGGSGAATESLTLDEAISGRRFIDHACVRGQPASDSLTCETGFASD